jgi:hypothetical protein
MTRKSETFQVSIESVSRRSPLRDCVRRALHFRRGRLHALVAAAGIASVTPLALGAAFPPVVPLASLYPARGGDGSRGFVLTGIAHFEHSGDSVSRAGDVNGDGIDDFIVGASAGAGSNAGESFVVFGSAQGSQAIFPLQILYPAGGGDGSRGFVLVGVDVSDYSGPASAAGDVNGDGVDDLIIGAWSADPGGDSRAGESYVVFGSAQGLPAVFPLRSLYPAGGGDGSRGFVLTGIDEEDHSGYSVSAAGDVNGDGIDDLVVGAPDGDPGRNTNAGESYVVFGTTQGFPAVLPLARLFPTSGGDGSRGFVLTGIDLLDYSGRSVSAAGDVNGDGIDDLVVGAEGADPGGVSEAGESYVVFGSAQGFPAVFLLESLDPAGGGDGSLGFVLTGIDEDDQSGASVSAAGDVNGDGLDDLIIGAPQNRTPRAGEAYVVFGTTQGFPAVFPLESLEPAGGGDGSLGFVLTGIHSRDYAGFSVSAAGDVNGDGTDDVIIGAYGVDQGNDISVGESYVVLGSTQGFSAIMPLEDLFPGNGGDGSRGFVLRGIDDFDHSGPVSGAGDVNADGIDDVIIGAELADPRGEDSAGESYVVFGRAAAP